MGKRGDWRALFALGIVLILLLGLVSADHTATITFTPQTVYETTTSTFNLSIGNFGSEDDITRVETTITGLEITGVRDFKKWNENFTSSSVTWSSGSIATNVLKAIFQFTARAPTVSSNTNHTLTVTTYDDANDQETQTVQFTILNDETGPLFSNAHPQDGDFVAQGTNAYTAQIIATDPETGVDHVDVSYQICNSSNQTQFSLTKVNDTYSRIIDLSSYDDGIFLCFAFSGESNGDATSTYTGRLGIDGIPPSVTLVGPNHGTMINAQAQFQFNVTDNLAATLRCELVIDGTVIANASVVNGATGSFSAANASEGIHTWNVACTDTAGLSGAGSTRTYTLDKTPPALTSTPANGSIMAGGTVISITLTDNFQLNQVTLTYNGSTTTQPSSFTLDTTAWPDGQTMVTVTASDQAGNVGNYVLIYTVDRTPPVISLLSPLNSSDVHVNFTFNAFDTYDNTLSCELYVDNVLRKKQNTTTLTTGIIDLIVPGAHTWRIECLDDANNRGVSANQQVTIVDMSGPDVVITDVPYFIRASPLTITADITDVSGIQSVTATLRDPANNVVTTTLTNSGSTYTLTYPTTMSTPLGTYAATFTATDTLNYSNSASKSFPLTYAYLITLTLSPTQTQPESGVSVSGNVVKDDNTKVPESTVTLFLPGNQSAQVPLDASGNYVYAFNAPSDDGVYDIIASITSAQNNVTYNATEQLTVSSPGNSNSEGNGGGARGRGVAAGGSSASSTSSSSPTSSTSSTSTTSPSTSEGEESDDESSSEKKEKKEKDKKKDKEDKKDDKETAGVGKAAGFFNLERLKDPKLIWTFLVLLGILTMFATISRRGKNEEKGTEEQTSQQDRFGLEDYIKQRKQ
ncbi:hypothetical protein HY488_02295 [Candidatus Woesearchaeota archaeon]|nr:hypothetical protein [Candidatus Woesearchaeota archaeon]